MNAKTLAKVNRFGKVGKIIMTILTVAAVAAAFLCCAAAIRATAIPTDAVKVSVTNHAEFRIDENRFASFWESLCSGFSYASDEDPSSMLEDGSSQILPPEDTKLDAELNFFNQSYTSATIRSDGNEKVIEAESAPAEYRFSDLSTLFGIAALFAASVAAALWMLQKIFKVLSVCDSPFCMDFVSRLRAFGYSLLPVALFASVGETLAVRFVSVGTNHGVYVQWGLLIAFAVTMCLVTVFRYGTQLQKESDETL